MKLFNEESEMNLAQAVAFSQSDPDALLIDVRDADEYAQCHIPGSVNLPLRFLARDIGDLAPDLETPLLLYCLSGARSSQAATILTEFGYENAISVGGITGYAGELEK